MAKQKSITAKNVATLPLSDEGKKRAYHDGGGLYVICEPGAKGINRSYNFRFTIGGKEAWHRIAHVDDLSLSAARDKAGEYRVMVNEGKDPRRVIGTTAAGQETFKAYLTKHWDSITGGKPLDHYRWNYIIAQVPKLHGMPIGVITNDDVHEAIKPFWRSHPASAPEVLQKVGKVFRHAKVRKLRVDNPADIRELRDLGLPKTNHKAKHHNALPFAELPAFMKKLAYQPEMSARCLEWCILTAARSNEARQARWTWLNADMTTITIPGEYMKNGQEHVVPLATQLTEMLAKLPRTSEYIFPSDYSFGCNKPYYPHALLFMTNRVLGLTGEKPAQTIKVHGFRSTFRNYAADKRLDEDAILELCLAHEIGNAARKAYVGNLVERRRPVMQAFADYALGAAPKGKVVPIKKTA
jgi:integrase